MSIYKKCIEREMRYDTVRARMKKGWTEDEAFGATSVQDHDGNDFYSTKEMW